MELTNKDGITVNGKWDIPDAGRKNVGFITSEDKENEGKVLSIDDVPTTIDGKDGFKVILMKEYKEKRAYENLKFQKWERSVDHEEHFVLVNQQNPDKYFLFANEDKTMSVGVELPKSTTLPPPTKAPPAPTPTAGADSKTIKISAIFIQLLLLVELLMM